MCRLIQKSIALFASRLCTVVRWAQRVVLCSGKGTPVPRLVVLVGFGTLMVGALPQAWAEVAESPLIARGEYVYHMAGCASCHVDAEGKEPGPAGGVPLETPFGTFYTPNITPDPTTGIGNWTAQDFVAAMKEGVSPEGAHYFPAFPYTSYVRMQAQDLLDLKAYLDTLPPVEKRSREHDLSFPFDQRWLMGFWKALFFDRKPLPINKARSEAWNRGAYIVNGPGHCVECHTPRNLFGAMQQDALLAGNPNGPDGGSVPAIDPASSEAFRQWSHEDIVFSLQTGMMPDGDFLGGSMGHVVENTTSRLNERDLKAIAEYLQSPTLPNAGGPRGLFFWLVWLLPIAGVIWFVLRRSGRKSGASSA